jgi:glycosyltransferase involved in cell wall biosynthesis
MRVGIDYRPALVNREGIGRYTRELVRALVEQEFGSSLGLFGYTLAGMRFSRAELGLVGARAELVRLRWPSKALPWLLARLGKGVDDLVGGAEVYHHTQYSRLPVRSAAEVATIHDCIYLLDADYLDRGAAERMTLAARELARGARRVIVPSEYVGAEVVMKLGVWPNKVSVVGHGCDHVVRHLPPGRVAKERYVLTVSRVDNRKNHLRMLKAFERLVREGLPHRWIVAGPPGYGSGAFERALSESPARERVEWLREVPEGRLAELYARADLFLFASLNEAS